MRLLAIIAILSLLAPSLLAQPAQGASVSGRVFEDRNQNGAFDAGELCVASIVSLRPAVGGAEQTARVECGPAATYAFAALAPGEYLVGVKETIPPEYDPSGPEPLKRVTLRDQDAVRLDLPVLRRTGTVHGRVFEDLDGSGTWGAGDACVPSVVSLRSVAGGAARTARVDCRYGVYVFSAVEPGTYRLSVAETTPPDYGAAEAVVTLAAGGVIQQDLLVTRPSIEGTVRARDEQPLPGAVVLLQDDTGGLLAVTTTDSTGQYRFTQLAAGVYQVLAADPPATESSEAFPGLRAERVNDHTLKVTVVPGLTQYRRNDFLKNLSGTAAASIERLLEVGQSVDVTNEIGYSSVAPVDLDLGDSVIRRITTDGALIVLNPEQTALLRLGAAGAELLLDSARRDADDVGLTRLLRVETGRDGISALLALRADDTRGIYRLEVATGSSPATSPSGSASLRRLALLPGTTGPGELAISDGGRIAFVAPAASGPLALTQQASSGTVEFELRQGQELNGALIEGFSQLTANDAGDLAFLVSLRRVDGTQAVALARRTSGGLALIVTTGGSVPLDRGGGTTGPLLGIVRPRIGPDGTIVFGGWGSNFSNYYAARPGRPLQALLPGSAWSLIAAQFDYASSADGTVALRAFSFQEGVARLYLAPPAGDPIPLGRSSLEPVGRPVFGPGGPLFFQAKNPVWPRDRNGRIPVGLFRHQNGVTRSVAAPGDEVPGSPGQQLLGVPQHPVVSTDTVAFAATFGGSDRFPVPTAGLFRMPLSGTVAEGRPVAEQEDRLQGTAQLVALRDFYYTTEGSLIFDTRVRRWLVTGQLVLSLAPAATVSGFGTQAVRADTPTPVLTQGDDLGAGRRLKQVLGRLVAVPPGRHLFAAEFIRENQSFEGLFTIDGNRQVQPVALKNEPALGPGLAGASFVGFGSTLLNPPSVSPDGNVVFRARLEREGVDSLGLFQWRGGSPTAIGLTHPSPDNIGRSAEDRPPYRLERWAAGLSGEAFFLEQHQNIFGEPVSRLFAGSAGGPALLAAPGITRVGAEDPSVLTELSDLVVNGAGELFLQGAAAGSRGVFRVERDSQAGGALRLMPVIRQGAGLPPREDGQVYSGLQFDGTFGLRRSSACGPLFFEAGVWKPGARTSRTRGIFYINAQGQVRTGLVEAVRSDGAREVTVAALPPDLPCDQPLRSQSVTQNSQEVRETLAFARRNRAGRWAIYRSRTVRNTATGRTSLSIVLVAREDPQPGGLRFVSLDPSALLGLPGGSGPVLAVNAAGDVAFLASDGERWGIYRFSGG